MARNLLNHGDIFRLFTWASDNAEACKTEDYSKLAERAAKALGIVVTGHNMAGAIKSVGIERKSKREKPPAPVEELARAILSLAEKSGLDPINRAAIEQLAGTGQPALLLTEKAN